MPVSTRTQPQIFHSEVSLPMAPISRQIPKVKILKSVERKMLTATFGTACPPRGVSGRIRQYAYTLSEAKKSHWILLLIADRVDVLEGAVEGLIKGQPDHLIAEMGLLSEFKRHGFKSRFRKNRADVRRQGIELLLFSTIGVGIFIFFQVRKIKSQPHVPQPHTQ